MNIAPGLKGNLPTKKYAAISRVCIPVGFPSTNNNYSAITIYNPAGASAEHAMLSNPTISKTTPPLQQYLPPAELNASSPGSHLLLLPNTK